MNVIYGNICQEERTVEPDRALRLTERVLADAAVSAKVSGLQVVDCQLHVGAVAGLGAVGAVLAGRQQHHTLVHPVADGARERLYVTVNGDAGTHRRTHELVRNPDHRRDYTREMSY